MAELERRVSELELVFGEFLVQSTLSARRAEAESQLLKEQIKEFKNEMKVFKDSMEKTIIELKESTLELKNTTEQTRKERASELERVVAQTRKEMSESKAELERVVAQTRKEMSESKAELERVVEQTRKEMSESKAELERVVAQTRKEMSESKAELERVVAQTRKEMSESKAELERVVAQTRKEMSESKAELNKKWGDLANKLGTVVEDIVAPNIPTIAKKYFKVEEIQRIMMNLYIKSESLKKEKEFDLILVAKDLVILNETKTTVRQNYLEEFIQSLPEFFEFFPELKGRKLIPIFSSMSFTPPQLAYLTKHKIYAMSMSGDTMELLNFDEIPFA
jgi:myosin heavy subunit